MNYLAVWYSVANLIRGATSDHSHVMAFISVSSDVSNSIIIIIIDFMIFNTSTIFGCVVTGVVCRRP